MFYSICSISLIKISLINCSNLNPYLLKILDPHLQSKTVPCFGCHIVVTTTRRGKTTNLKKKALSFNKNIFCMKIFFIENSSLFYSLANQGFKLISRNTCLFVFKSSFLVNSLIAKLERVAMLKMFTSVNLCNNNS